MSTHILSATYTETPSIHDGWRKTYRGSAQLRLDEHLYTWLFQKLKPNGSWLDVGCGSGERTLMLAERSPSVVALDISPNILHAARARASHCDAGDRVHFECLPIEELPPDLACDNVHCRGVLMHVPDWRSAVANLCKNVKAGGYLVLFEADCRSLETLVVRGVRFLGTRKSKIIEGDGGLEFWSDVDGKPFLVRMANLDALEEAMRANGVQPLLRQPAALLDPFRAPRWAQKWIIKMNELWFRAHLPFGSGTILVGQKAA